jgi:hypothetical protein
VRRGLALWLAVLVIAVAGCSGRGASDDSDSAGSQLARGLSLLPDEAQLGRHVLVADLDRLRTAYGDAALPRTALVGVWLPDALVGANRPVWRRSFGLPIGNVSTFASAGFHPAEVTVAEGRFSPPLIQRRLRESGYGRRGKTLARGADGSFDATSELGRLVLSALDRVVVSRARVIAASTSALADATGTSSPRLAGERNLAAAARALDPITSAVILDARLVRPPSGVPFSILPAFSARVVGVGIDDLGAEKRTLKIALVYDVADRARSDAAVLERDLASAPLLGAPGSRFSDIAPEWKVSVEGPAIAIAARLPRTASPGIWRLLVERGDLGVLVRPRG